jgi:trehalose/maltose hydrolase-like predicted phosphorylase
MRPTSLKNLKKAKLNLLFNQSQITLSSSHYAKNVMHMQYCASWWPCQHLQLAYLLSSSLHSSKKFICFGSHCYSAEDRASSCDVYSASSSVDSSLSCTVHAFRASPWTASLKIAPMFILLDTVKWIIVYSLCFICVELLPI